MTEAPVAPQRVIIERRARGRKALSETAVRFGALTPSKLLRQVRLPEVRLLDLSEEGGRVRAPRSPLVTADDRLIVQFEGAFAEVIVVWVRDEPSDESRHRPHDDAEPMAQYGFRFVDVAPAVLDALRHRLAEDGNALEFLWRVWSSRPLAPLPPPEDVDARGRVRAVALEQWRRSVTL